MNPFIGEVIMFGGNFAPRGWAFCEGQLLSISQNTALFSILGTMYGGDGRTTFGLPDLRGRVAIHEGHGPGLSTYSLGEKGGAPTATLNTTTMPFHNHFAASNADMNVSDEAGEDDPDGNYIGGGQDIFSASPSAGNKLADGAATTTTSLTNTGNGQSFDIEQPYLVTKYIIALFGVYPSRN